MDRVVFQLICYGHGDLKFEVQGNGYLITRQGIAANGLSEGEKTAIAFLYFLKSLNDKSLKIQDGIVVIDDTVSGLDANSLFCAFGFMQASFKDAGDRFPSPSYMFGIVHILSCRKGNISNLCSI